MISNLPIMPQDLFTREISAHFSLPFKVVKTVFDLSCVSLSLAVAFLALGRIVGVGGRDPGERAYHRKMRGCGETAAIIHKTVWTGDAITRRLMLMCGKVTQKNLIDNSPLFRKKAKNLIEISKIFWYNKDMNYLILPCEILMNK